METSFPQKPSPKLFTVDAEASVHSLSGAIAFPEFFRNAESADDGARDLNHPRGRMEATRRAPSDPSRATHPDRRTHETTDRPRHTPTASAKADEPREHGSPARAEAARQTTDRARTMDRTVESAPAKDSKPDAPRVTVGRNETDAPRSATAPGTNPSSAATRPTPAVSVPTASASTVDLSVAPASIAPKGAALPAPTAEFAEVEENEVPTAAKPAATTATSTEDKNDAKSGSAGRPAPSSSPTIPVPSADRTDASAARPSVRDVGETQRPATAGTAIEEASSKGRAESGAADARGTTTRESGAQSPARAAAPTNGASAPGVPTAGTPKNSSAPGGRDGASRPTSSGAIAADAGRTTAARPSSSTANAAASGSAPAPVENSEATSGSTARSVVPTPALATGETGSRAAPMPVTATAGAARPAMAPELVMKLAPGLEAQLAAKAKEYLAKGATEIRIALDPPELGRVRVHLEISDGHAIARIVASSHEAAALLAKDREDLIRAFQNQGFDEVHVQVESDDSTSTRGRDGEDRRPGDGRDGPAPASNDRSDRRTSPLERITRTSLDVFA